MLAEESEKSLEETQRRLNRRETELQSQESRAVSLEERLSEVTRALTLTRDENGQLRSTVSSLDRDKDALQLTVDDKTERLAQLNNELLGRVGAPQMVHTHVYQHTVYTHVYSTHSLHTCVLNT